MTRLITITVLVVNLAGCAHEPAPQAPIVLTDVVPVTCPPAEHRIPDASLTTPLGLEATIILPKGSARFEQTDYGHAGRFNPWDPRGIDSPLQPRTSELKALCEAITQLL